MPFSLSLPKVEAKAGWKVKIFDNEGAEEPHISVICKGDVKMRISLRTWQPIIPPGGKLSGLPSRIVDAILDPANQAEMTAYWDDRFPHNPVLHEDNS